MKRVIIFNILLLVFVATINSQNDCDISLQEAQKAYNEKNYPLTKILCNHIISNCGENYGNVQEILQEIEEANNPSLFLSSKDIFLDYDSTQTQIYIDSNIEWGIKILFSDIFSVSKKDNKIIINIEENNKPTARHRYFDVISKDGLLSNRVNIYQFSKSSYEDTLPKIELNKRFLLIEKSKIFCSAHADTNYIEVKSNFPWDIQYEEQSTFSFSRIENKIMIISKENTTIESITERFFIRTLDNKIIKKVTIVKSGNTEISELSPKATNSSNYGTNTNFQSNKNTELKTDRTSIYCTSNESVEIVNVSSNKPWEIINVQSSFFTTQKNNNSIVITIQNNSTNFTRSGTITLQTVDGKETQTINITQTGIPASTKYDDTETKEKKKREWPQTFIHIII